MMEIILAAVICTIIGIVIAELKPPVGVLYGFTVVIVALLGPVTYPWWFAIIGIILMMLSAWRFTKNFK